MGAPKGHPPYPGCETGGRPKKWTDEALEKLADHLLDTLEKALMIPRFFSTTHGGCRKLPPFFYVYKNKNSLGKRGSYREFYRGNDDA